MQLHDYNFVVHTHIYVYIHIPLPWNSTTIQKNGGASILDDEIKPLESMVKSLIKKNIQKNGGAPNETGGLPG